MKITELRIGNHVQRPDGTVLTIYELERRTEKTSRINDITFDNRCIDDFFQPISLTEDRLLEFGFEKYSRFEYNNAPTYHVNIQCFEGSEPNKYNIVGSDMSVCLSGSKFRLLKNVCEDNEYIEEGVEIPYIHTLQNLHFALTGEELYTIKNP